MYMHYLEMISKLFRYYFIISRRLQNYFFTIWIEADLETDPKTNIRFLNMIYFNLVMISELFRYYNIVYKGFESYLFAFWAIPYVGIPRIRLNFISYICMHSAPLISQHSHGFLRTLDCKITYHTHISVSLVKI